MSIVDNLLKIVAPHSCLSCGREGELVCNWCMPDACPPVPPRCYSCYVMTENSEVCAKCRRKSPLKHVWVRTEYQDLARELIRKYKFSYAQDSAKLIASEMQNALPYLAETIIVAVPTATARIRQRGFDHAELLAKNLARLTKLPHAKVLRRIGQAEQVGQSKLKRQVQLSGAFRANPVYVAEARVLLVDDVVTTGATLEEAARALKLAGAKTIDAVVFAQKM